MAKSPELILSAKAHKEEYYKRKTLVDACE